MDRWVGVEVWGRRWYGKAWFGWGPEHGHDHRFDRVNEDKAGGAAAGERERS